MKKNAGLISFTMALVTGIQIIGQILVAKIFGPQVELDAFVSAVTFPTLLTTVIAGTLNDAFLPKLKAHGNHDLNSQAKYFFQVSLLLSIIILGICLIIDYFSGSILSFFFKAKGESFIVLTGSLMKIMIYTLPFTLFGTLSASYLYSKGQFILPSFSYLVGSALNLILIILLTPTFGIWSMVIGFISSVLMQFIFTFPFHLLKLLDLNSLFKLDIFTKHEIFLLLAAWTPLIISAIAIRFDNILLRSFAANLPEGYIVYTNLVSKLFSGLVGLITVGLQIVFYPHLLDVLKTKNIGLINRRVIKAKFIGTLLTASVLVIILFISPYFIRYFLIGGKFSSGDVEVLISLFPYFIVPAVGWGIANIFAQPVVALGKQHLLTVINITAVIISWLIASFLNDNYGTLFAISVGLTILTFSGIIGSEIIWQLYLKKKSI